MAFLGPNAYLELDRYYQAIVVLPAGLSGGELSKIFKENHIWWWELSSGDYEKIPGTTWHYAMMKNVGANVRPSSIQRVLGPSIIAISDAPVNDAVELFFIGLEHWAAFGAGFDPEEGATMAAEEPLAANAYYAVTVEWASKRPALKQEEIAGLLEPLGISIFDIDKCLPTLPIPYFEGTGNLLADTVKYYEEYPNFASFVMVGGTDGRTVRDVRDALGARNIYVARKKIAGVIDGAALAKLCGFYVALQNIAFFSSRTLEEVIKKGGNLVDPKNFSALFGVASGFGLAWIGYKIFSRGRGKR